MFAIEQQRKRQRVAPKGPKQIADVVVVQDGPCIAPELQGEEHLTRTKLKNIKKCAREKAAKEARQEERTTRLSVRKALADIPINAANIAVQG